MKVRVCPKCGKHNNANAFNCTDCGTTLSMKTLVDLDSGKLLNVKPIAGYTELADISPYFEQDVDDMIKHAIPFNEKILWGCSITHLPSLPLLKHITLGFLFGYVLITDQRLVCVYFASDMVYRKPVFRLQKILNEPKRSYLHVFTTPNSLKPMYVIGLPGYELSIDEKRSQQISICLLSDLESIRMELTGSGDVSLSSLIIKLRQGDETSITFLGIHQAEKAHKLLVGILEAQPY
jgi:hypothetical protein